MGANMPALRRILIALPTVARNMKTQTAISIARTVQVLGARGVAVDLHNIDSAEIVTARDMFANMLLYTPGWDALLFIDSDMGFDANLILRMVDQDGEVIAAACPRRTIDLPRFVAAANSHGSLAKAASQASAFTVFFSWDEEVTVPQGVRDGFCSAAAAGMAIALITKTALQDMITAKVVSPRLDLNASGGEPCYSFFGILDHNGRLGEDYSFCYRWTKLMGRDLRLCIDEEVVHVGDWEYRGRFVDTL
jgi:hypothetical protein